MAKLNETSETFLSETVLDEEDELDGWGPVRVRRSTLPPQADCQCSGETVATCSQPAEALNPKRLIT